MKGFCLSAGFVADGALIGCFRPTLASWHYNARAWRDCDFDDGFRRRMSNEGEIRLELRSMLLRV